MTRLSPSILFAGSPLTGRLPTQVRVAPGGDFVTFLQPAADDRERLDLWCYDVSAHTLVELLNARTFAAGTLTEAERAERERRRQFAGGITPTPGIRTATPSCSPSPDRPCCTISSAGPRTPVKALRCTPDRHHSLAYGAFVSYVRAGDLYVHDLHTGQEHRVTRDGGGTVSSGLPEFIAQEEMHRFEGHWWSPDEPRLAYTRVDVADIPESYRSEIAADRIETVAQRYPFAGGENAEVRLAVVGMDDGEPGEPSGWIGAATATRTCPASPSPRRAGYSSRYRHGISVASR